MMQYYWLCQRIEQPPDTSCLATFALLLLEGGGWCLCLAFTTPLNTPGILFSTHPISTPPQSVHGHANHVDDPELTRNGQPSVPETLLLLHQKVERLSKPIQALHDLADILVQPTQKLRATAFTDKISGLP